jgi:zinc protease
MWDLPAVPGLPPEWKGLEIERIFKMIRNAIAIVILVLTASSVTAFGQGGQEKPDAKAPAAKPTEQLPTIDQVLDKYVKALGGKAAIQRPTSILIKGTFEVPAFNASGTMERFSKAPNKYALSVDIPGFGVIQQAFNGDAGWAQDPQSGLRDLSGVELAQTRREAEMYKDIKLKELYTKLVVKGKDKVGDKEVYLVEATPPEGGVEKLYFDTQSGLIVKTDIEAETPQGKMPVEIYLEDYKEVEGIKVPFSLRQVTPAVSFSIKLTEVKYNVPVDDSKFNKPAAQ